MKSILVTSIACISLIACQAANKATEVSTINVAEIESQITTILETQDMAWSAGNIDAFMETYWQSPDLRFASGGNIQRGWEGTKARYEKRYPDASIMGTLITGDHEFDVLSPNAAVVHGSWKLERDETPISGLYTLVFKNIDGQWVITSDTTTSAQ